MHGSNAQKFKDHARKEFDDWAEQYDRSVLHHLLFHRCYLKFIELITRQDNSQQQNLDILDVGCGTGTLGSMLTQCGISDHVVGLDMTIKMCCIGRQKAQHIGLGEKLNFVAGDSEHLPFNAGSFDIVTCSNSFHHYPAKLTVLEQFHRVLKPGGKLIILDGFRDNVIGWFLFDVCVAFAEKAVHHCPASQLRTLVSQTGFTDIHQEKFGFWVPVLATVGTKGTGKAADGENVS